MTNIASASASASACLIRNLSVSRRLPQAPIIGIEPRAKIKKNYTVSRSFALAIGDDASVSMVCSDGYPDGNR